MVSIIADQDIYLRIAHAIPEIPVSEPVPVLGPGGVTGRAEGVFLQVGTARDGVPIGAVEALVRGAPWLPIVPVVTGEEEPGRIIALGALGMSRVLTWPTDGTAEGWRRSVSDLLCSALGDMVLRRLDAADPVLRRGLAWAVASAHREPTLEGLAERMGLGRRSLRRHLAGVGRATPGEILTLGRVIQGMYRLRVSTLSVERVALIVGFSGASGFRRALQRHVGLRPSELRQGTRMRRTLELLLHSLAGGPRLMH